MKSDDWIEINKNPLHVSRERNKARELRKSNWWKNQLSIGLCYYCQKKFTSNELTMDHILPVSRGGKSNKTNCVTCCKSCNSEKGFLTPAEIILRDLNKS